MRLGAQFYTVREYTKDLESFSETLKRVADIGYEFVQVSATCDFQADWLKDELKKNGLGCVVTHTKPDRIADDTITVCNEHKIFDCKYVGIGYPPGGIYSMEEYVAFRDRFLPVEKLMKENGITLGYHNHSMEFIKYDGEPLINYIAKDFKDTVFILDTYWIQYAGGDPAQWIRKFAGKVPCVHFKDFAMYRDEQRMAVIGEGNINFDAVISACEEAGTEYVLIEQDDLYGENPFDCLERSYKYLKSLGLN